MATTENDGQFRLADEGRIRNRPRTLQENDQKKKQQQKNSVHPINVPVMLGVDRSESRFLFSVSVLPFCLKRKTCCFFFGLDGGFSVEPRTLKERGRKKKTGTPPSSCGPIVDRRRGKKKEHSRRRVSAISHRRLHHTGPAGTIDLIFPRRPKHGGALVVDSFLSFSNAAKFVVFFLVFLRFLSPRRFGFGRQRCRFDRNEKETRVTRRRRK